VDTEPEEPDAYWAAADPEEGEESNKEESVMKMIGGLNYN